MISVSLLSAGSTVYAEAPSYIKSLQVFQSAGMRLTGVPMDARGLDVNALGQLIGDGRAASPAIGQGDAVLYTIPTNHNPTGITMPEERRRALLAACTEHRLPIIEDCAYQDLVFEGPTPRPLAALDDNGMVITVGSASKALAPGLRIGWVCADERIVHRLADVKMQMDYGASTLSQWVFARFLDSGLYAEYLESLRAELRRRRDAALETLERLFAGRAHWNVPRGGFYIWLTFDEPVHMGRLFQRAIEHGILLNPGDIYDFRGNNALRLSYVYTAPEEFAGAAQTLAKLV